MSHMCSAQPLGFTAQAFALALQDVLMVQSNSLQQLPRAVAARQHGEAEQSNSVGSVPDEMGSSDITILEVLVHTTALRQQLQLLAGLQVAIIQTTEPGALKHCWHVPRTTASALQALAPPNTHCTHKLRIGKSACAGQNGMAILRSLHRALKLAQSEEWAAVLRYLLLHAVRPLLMDVYGWLVAVEQPVHFHITPEY